MITPQAPRYERIVSLVLVVLLGLSIIFLIDVNPYILRARFSGDLPTITVSWLLMASLVVITSTGADLLARSHPRMQTLNLPILHLGPITQEIAPGFWILPSFSVIASFAFFRLFSAGLQGIAFVLALIVAGGLLFTVLVCQYYALEREQRLHQKARLILQIITYLLAFGCFSAIYYTRFRTLYAATLIGISGTLLTYEILRWLSLSHSFELSLLVGLLLGESMWALNYWATTFLLGGTVLLVIFYITTSLLHHQLTGTLQRRLIIEYGLIGGILLGAIIYVTLRGVI